MTGRPYLENEPNEGVTVEDDLSTTTITLTRRRGLPGRWNALLVALLVCSTLLPAMVFAILYLPEGASGAVGGLAGLNIILAAFLWDRFRTTLVLRPHSMDIEITRPHRSERSVLPYADLQTMEIDETRWGPVLRLDTTEGEVRIPYGTTDDLRGVVEEIRARLPETPSQTPIRPPQALEDLRRRTDAQ